MNPFSKKKPTSREVVRQSRQDLARASRGVEREISILQKEEKKLVVEIKMTAKSGNEKATKILARQLVRLKQQIVKLQGSRAQVRSVAIHTQAMHANTSVGAGMESAARAMGAINKQMTPEKQMKIMQDFQKETAKMGMTSEMMSDSLDDALDEGEEEDESEDLMNQVLDEIGVDISAQMSSAPRGKIAAKGKEDIERYWTKSELISILRCHLRQEEKRQGRGRRISRGTLCRA